MKISNMSRPNDTVYLFGWMSCPLCGKNIDMVQRKRYYDDGRQTRVLVQRPKFCPHCKEQYKITNAGEFYSQDYRRCPDGCLMVMGENAES